MSVFQAVIVWNNPDNTRVRVTIHAHAGILSSFCHWRDSIMFERFVIHSRMMAIVSSWTAPWFLRMILIITVLFVVLKEIAHCHYLLRRHCSSPSSLSKGLDWFLLRSSEICEFCSFSKRVLSNWSIHPMISWASWHYRWCHLSNGEPLVLRIEQCPTILHCSKHIRCDSLWEVVKLLFFRTQYFGYFILLSQFNPFNALLLWGEDAFLLILWFVPRDIANYSLPVILHNGFDVFLLRIIYRSSQERRSNIIFLEVLIFGDVLS